MTNLPLDHARSSGANFAPAVTFLELDAESTACAHRLAQVTGDPLPSILLGVFAGMTHWLAQQSDLLVGVTLQQGTGIALPVRFRVDDATGLRQLAAQAVKAWPAGEEHAALPPDAHGSAHQPGASRTGAIFHFSADAIDIEGLTFDLLLHASMTPRGLQLNGHYDSAVLDRATVERWLQIYRSAIVRWASDAHAEISLVAAFALGESDRALLASFNATSAAQEAGLRIETMIARQVAATPEAIAVTAAGGVQLSFEELARRANGLAAALKDHGVGAGDLVGLSCDRNEHMLVGLYGILQAGAGYVPLDPSFPTDRLTFMTEDAQLRVMVVDGSTEGRWSGTSLAIVRADEIEPSAAMPAPHHDAEAVAYVIYTSGSTGRPKGVRVPHRSVCNLLSSLRSVPEIRTDHVTLAVTTLSFDIAVSELLLPLTVGSRIVVADKAQAVDGSLLRSLVEREKVTFIDATPSTWRLLLAAGWPGCADMLAICTGEPLPPDLGRKLLPMVQQLWNGYGPTETTVWSSFHRVEQVEGTVPIGRPVANTQFHVLNAALQPLPVGVVGELFIGGAGVTLGYLNRPELTAERFLPDSFRNEEGALLYRTGDLGRWRADGVLECLGRNDHQVKIRGYRIELGEIESALSLHAAIDQSVVIAREDQPGNVRLVAYFTAKRAPGVDALRAHLATRLPPYMVPTAFVALDALPLLPNGKLDRRSLPAPPTARPELSEPYEEGRSPTERHVCDVFAKVLGIDNVGRTDNFFDLGGDSILVLRALAELQKTSAQPLSANMFFQQPTPEALGAQLDSGTSAQPPIRPEPARERLSSGNDEPIALIGMAGRFPGAASVEQFWDNLCAGRDSISFFDEATLDPAVKAVLRDNPNYVRARGLIDDVEWFDAAFFGINPKEAELMDPQQRLFLEICWECMERAGYTPDQCPGSVGVFAGMNNATYFLHHVQKQPDMVDDFGAFQVMLANEKDYIATRVAHRLNLTGPAIAIHTACSTSLVAVAQAFHALRSGQCDAALAGGIAITCPPRSGYLYEEGAMLSPDGHTRSFDERAQGTVFSDGAGVVMLKRLSDALVAGDPIYAVLRGVAVNNDGGAKASFTAPSIDGQAAVISASLASAGVDARSISYVETHGTATPMGDPVEIEGLTRAFARHTSDTDFCRIGSVKSNVGHLVTAAGVAGLIKTALALHTERIPPTVHFTRPNPRIRFETTPFRVNDSLHHWPRADAPRRAGVSSFGVGGTNAHVIVEEAPSRDDSDISAAPQLLVLSARTPTALAAARTRLAAHLEAHPRICLPDVAHTLRVGRKIFAHRACVVARSPAEAAAALRTADGSGGFSGTAATSRPQPVLLFPGQDAPPYRGMGRALYAQEPVFRAAFDECHSAFERVQGFDLRAHMFADDPAAFAQAATFAIEYALARQLLALQVKPAAMLGHGVGAFVAAVLAGVMQLDDAVKLVELRADSMHTQRAEIMLSISRTAAELSQLLPEGVSLAADNGPTGCLVAGPIDGLERLRASLEAQGIESRLFLASRAINLTSLAGTPCGSKLPDIRLSAPRLPIYSTLTGRLLTPEEATDPSYWVRHLRETVRFSPALSEVTSQLGHPLFIEIGPRHTVPTLSRHRPAEEAPSPAIVLLGNGPHDECSAWRLAAGRIWAMGAEIDLVALDERANKHRVPLPTYPFERKRCWLDATAASATSPDLRSHGMAPVAVAPAPDAAREPTASAAPHDGLLQQVVASQMQLMQQQLTMLSASPLNGSGSMES
ncbi:amino acid adenylation domain-containing protein [Variovorax sp. J2P1-59]|uniref:polyketide synthase n=1 Tax=Variovorax flavidus TaxID=3053501 RepID=UPI0025764711|nr:polyketide synthase [Variovorax sp. J2P1-59]MDM0078570.1 amino acid adenylation domain-containing protein [Variovorax sp. J2P1-59]